MQRHAQGNQESNKTAPHGAVVQRTTMRCTESTRFPLYANVVTTTVYKSPMARGADFVTRMLDATIPIAASRPTTHPP